MIKSDKIDELAKALVKVQSKIKGAIKDSNNPFFKSKYADLASNWDAAKEAGIHEEGLTVVQTNTINERGTVVVETTLLHTSGQFITGQLEMPVAKQNDPQAVGSAITYGRRYALASILGISPEDDDGNKAAGKVEDKKTYTSKPVSKPETVSQSNLAQLIGNAKSVSELTQLIPELQNRKAELGDSKFEELKTLFREKKLNLSKDK